MPAICANLYSQRTDGLISGMPRLGECRMQRTNGAFIIRLLRPGHLHPDTALARPVKLAEEHRLPGSQAQLAIGNDNVRAAPEQGRLEMRG